MEEVISASEQIGSWPLLIRPAFTLGGLGGGTAWNVGELVEIATLGLRNSRINQVLIEESILGWQELEYEVMRDEADNAIIVVLWKILIQWEFILVNQRSLHHYNHSPIGTIRFFDQALALIRALNIKGGCNVQFAFNQFTGEIRVIEVNPRVSRSSVS